MYMNLKPNKHKRISFNKTTMVSLGFIAPALKFSSPPPKKIKFFAQVPLNYFGLKFLGPPLKLGGAATMKWALKAFIKPFEAPQRSTKIQSVKMKI